jgi:hypothetical protein
MKKTYSKPDIIFDSFALSTNVAANCEFKTPLPKADECGMPIGFLNDVIFITEMQGCTKIIETGAWDTICYHQPTEENNLFNS